MSESCSSSSGMSAAKKRLFELQLKRNEARKLNHQEVVEEDKRKALPASWDNRKRKAQWEMERDEIRQKAIARGVDPERAELIDRPAEIADQISTKQKEKKDRQDTGFADYESCTVKQYQKLSKKLGEQVNMKRYNERKKEMGGKFYADADTLGIHEVKDSTEAVDRLSEEMSRQRNVRNTYSRRRGVDPDADIDYISERNRHFNKKLERFYGQYTREIKDNLERGTAI